RKIMVVKAGLLPRDPAEQPDVEVMVAVEAHVDPLLGIVADEHAPQVGAGGQPLGERAHLVRLEVAVVAAALRDPCGDGLGFGHGAPPRWLSTRSGFCSATARPTKGPSPSSVRRSGAGSMTGTSVPSTICSAP